MAEGANDSAVTVDTVPTLHVKPQSAGRTLPSELNPPLAVTGPSAAAGHPSEPAPSTTATWVLGLLQAGDSIYPTGSYAHSFGLEGLVLAGVVHDRTSLREFIFNSALPALQHADLPIVTQAWIAAGKEDWPTIGRLTVLSSALKTAREARLASENIGRQRAELAAALHPNSVATVYLRQCADEGWPFSAAVAAAIEARTLGAPLDAALSSYAYTALASLISAAMKLLRLGQNGAQSLLTEALAAVPAAITAAKAIPTDDIGWFNPWLDIAAARHETADARMFIS
jgi:urease accessory protein